MKPHSTKLLYGSLLILLGTGSALHAETSNNELAKEIAELKAQIREMKGAISQTRLETRKTREKVKEVADHGPAPLPTFAVPPDATPVFVTSDKKMQYGALTITPGGFIAAESVYRTRDTQADILTGFNNIPTNNNPQAHLGEDRFSARQSRIAALVEAPISTTALVSGYGEFDFLGAGTTSNNNQSYSYVPRIRHLYSALDFGDYGIHVLAGQTWSLVTMNSKGITPRNEVTPPQIDAGYLPGFEYARLPQIRLTKDFDKKLWISLSAEASQSVGINNGGCANVVSNTSALAAAPSLAANGVASVNCLAVGTGGALGQQGEQTQYSFNKVPDVVGKVAYETKLGEHDVHLEGFGVYRDLLDNVSYSATNATNQNATGYGFGAGTIIAVIPKKLDFQASGLIGRGLGRYTSSGLPDATVNGNGSLKPLGAADALVGFTFHATPSIDLYAFAGFEQVNRNYSGTGAAEVGYGVPIGQNNSGCNTEGGTCTGVTHRIYQLTGGIWDKLYKGNFGEVRVGVQYSYTQRQLYGTQATVASPFLTAKADDNMVLTSFRYYPFQ